MKNHEEMLKEFLKDPANKKAYDDLEPEFAIHRALIKARIDKKLTQKELAKKLGVPQSAIARFESGKINSTLKFLQKITSGLGLKITIS